MKRIVLAPLFLAAVVLSAAAIASPQCTDAARGQWLAEAAMKQNVLDQGYTLKVFQVTSNCDQIYARDKAGKNVEIHFDPTDGHIVKKTGG